jgi:hypothetical protein
MEEENIPVTDGIESLRTEVAEIKAMLEPIVPFLAMLPELAEKVGPFLEGLQNSPVLKMLGIKV